MPSVVTFWQFPEEEQQFIEFLNGTGCVVAFPSGPVETESELVPQPLNDYISRYDPDQLLFGLEDFAEKRIVKQVEFEGQPRFCVTSMDSCLVGYRRGNFRDGNKLGQFNLAAYWTRLSDDGKSLVNKDRTFKKWAEKVFSWVREATPEWHQFKTYRVTRRVKEALLKGEIEIIP